MLLSVMNLTKFALFLTYLPLPCSSLLFSLLPQLKNPVKPKGLLEQAMALYQSGFEGAPCLLVVLSSAFVGQCISPVCDVGGVYR